MLQILNWVRGCEDLGEDMPVELYFHVQGYFGQLPEDSDANLE